MFEVQLAPAAAAMYSTVDQVLARKLARCFRQLEREPRRHNNIKRLTGQFAGLMRYRVGDWRVVYRIDEEELSVLVLTIAHRRDVYE